MGPSSIACLTKGLVEERLFSAYTVKILLLYKRFIDGIVGCAQCTRDELENFVNNFYPCFKFTHDISPYSVNFMDVKFTIKNRGLISTEHFKPTDSHNYLRYSSSHPPTCINAIPYSQLLRARRICSNTNYFERVSSEFCQFFKARGYPSTTLVRALDRIKSVDRNTALQPSGAKPSSDRMPLVLPFQPSIQPIRRAIYKNVKILSQDASTKDIFQDLPITAYKRQRNLSENLVRASDPLAIQTSNPGTFPCNRSRCNTCEFVTLDNFLQIEGPRKSFQINDHFTCTAANLVYIIACKRCKLLYIGETKRRLADRITEHLRSIRLHLAGFPIATISNPLHLVTLAISRSQEPFCAKAMALTD
ncbi:hypothetical protein HOLleu_00467 [Holothuria leucospilota]|uniref:GIY-YIG domain-containing protein n=1 Tax=Holothuria leucospilota TaxID=206669 RepID=A0A9Q1CP09_HOLLE|nr:hypothetical protein HOLleu_00467 [Holothuria leucospilota]